MRCEKGKNPFLLRLRRLCISTFTLICQMSVDKPEFLSADGKISRPSICRLQNVGTYTIFPIFGDPGNHDRTVTPSVRDNPIANCKLRILIGVETLCSSHRTLISRGISLLSFRSVPLDDFSYDQKKSFF